MNSHARFTYTEVASILAGNAPSDKEFKPLVNDLHNLYDLFKALKDARTRRGGIEFHQGPLSKGFSRQEYWSGLPWPPPADLPGPGIKPASLMSPELAGRFFTTSTTKEAPPRRV